MWGEQFTRMLALVVMASLLRATWELSRQHGHEMEHSWRPSVTANPDVAELAPWQKKASEKAVKRYAEAQGKKWQRWNEAMFEASNMETTATPKPKRRRQSKSRATQCR